jgi:hypothetical protein
MLRAVADGTLVIPIAKRFPLSEIRDAQGLAEKRIGIESRIETSAPPARVELAANALGKRCSIH